MRYKKIGKRRTTYAALQFWTLTMLSVLVAIMVFFIVKSYSKAEYALSNDVLNNGDVKGGMEGALGIQPEAEWKLVLVNKDNAMPYGYEPTLALVGSGYYFDERASEALLDMLDACRLEGLNPAICSAYRSIEQQTELYSEQIEKQKKAGISSEEAEVKAAAVVLYPGKSEHNLGLAVDIVSADYQILEEEQESTMEQQWLMDNCYKYGFILRYPKDKQEITNVIYEPWHYRYVGIEAATYITENNLCLEEFLSMIE